MNRNKEILHYVVPSVAAMLVTFLYVVVDGIFVGRGVGANALAAVNIAVPFTELMSAAASMLTIGGATVFAIRLGRGEKEKANDAFLVSAALVLGMAVIITVIGVFLPEQVAKLSGASPVLMAPTAEYIRYYCAFTVFFTMTICLSNFVRNDGRPGLAFWGMVAGALANVFLDWLFVFPLAMGIKGAAIASGLGQILSFGILCSHFALKRGALRVKRFRLTGALAAKVLGRGLPELITQLCQPLTILCYNYVVIRAMGETGVAAFSVICYLLTLITGVFLGVSQGLQPLIGRSFGTGDKAGEHYFLRAGLIINVGLSALVYGVLFLFGRPIIGIFNTDPALISIAYEAMGTYGFSFILGSVNIILTTYFFSTKRTKQAMAIAVSRGLLFNTLFIFSVPALLGTGAIWYSMVLAELVTVLIGTGLLLFSNREERRGAAAGLQKPLRGA